MAILQALISYLAKSAGKALNAIFGWAVLALFGSTSPKEQTMLSVVVAAAAAWPILLLGVVVPKVALLVIAFVPLSKSVPGFWLRLVWIALALPDHALAALVELAVFVVLALILGAIGAISLRRNIRSLKSGPLPKTMTTLKEDAEWAKHLLTRNGK